MLEEPIKEGVPPKMKGSVLMCVADTEEEVLERVKKDVYYTNDVWDKEKVSAFARMGTWDVSIEDTKEKMEDYLVGCCSMYLADHLSRSRSFRSRALFGRHLSEHDRMKIRFTCPHCSICDHFEPSESNKRLRCQILAHGLLCGHGSAMRWSVRTASLPYESE